MAVIPGRSEGADPESKLPLVVTGFRARLLCNPPE